MTSQDSQDKPKLQTADLKPCPFCGCSHIVLVGAFAFACNDCGARGPAGGYDEARAVDAWNGRV